MEGQAAVPVGGGGAWPDNESTHRTTRQHTRPHWHGGRRRDRRAWLRCRWAAAGPGQASSRRADPNARGRAAAHEHTRRRRCEGRRRDLPRCRWAVAGPGRASRRRAERSSRRGRLAGGRAHRHTQRPGPPTPGTPAEPQATTHGADSSRAAGPTGAQNTSGATRHLGTTKPPSPTGAGRLRQSAREGQRRITTMSGSPRPLS